MCLYTPDNHFLFYPFKGGDACGQAYAVSYTHLDVYKRQPLQRPFLRLITKKVAFKQSDLNYALRQKVKDKLVINNGNKVKGKNILIVDDIKTTGATIMAMINLIKPYNPRKIAILTLAETSLSE